MMKKYILSVVYWRWVSYSFLVCNNQLKFRYLTTFPYGHCKLMTLWCIIGTQQNTINLVQNSTFGIRLLIENIFDFLIKLALFQVTIESK